MDSGNVRGERLCLECGLCCRGFLHATTELDPDEVAGARAAGLPLVEIGGSSVAFRQPCPQHVDDCCTIYQERPRACRSYECKLLERHLRGEIGLRSSLEHVRRARSLIGELRDELEARDENSTLWAQIAAWSETGERRSPQTRLKIGVLWRLVREVFLPETADLTNWPDLQP